MALDRGTPAAVYVVVPAVEELCGDYVAAGVGFLVWLAASVAIQKGRKNQSEGAFGGGSRAETAGRLVSNNER